jgi:hypothetical protein
MGWRWMKIMKTIAAAMRALKNESLQSSVEERIKLWEH